jgi:curved DNA-binding protein CbpA
MSLRPNIQQCCDLLDLPPGFSAEDLKQAYKDLAQVWHPDRFSHNPRLQQKAEAKLKQINEAYDQLEQFIKQRQAAQFVAKATGTPDGRRPVEDHRPIANDVPTGMPHPSPINDASRLRLQLSALLIAGAATFGSLFGIILLVYLVAQFTPVFVALSVLGVIYVGLRWLSDRQT